MLFRKLFAKLRGKWVVLRDSDGEVNLRRAYKIGGTWFADRMDYGIATVSLNQDGTCSGRSYVSTWEPAPIGGCDGRRS